MENYFGIYVIFRRWNQRKRGPQSPQPTRACQTPLARSGVLSLLEHRLEPFFWRKKDNLWKKSCKFFSAIGVTDLREFKKP